MAEHIATVAWRASAGADFPGGRYSREHTWTFDGGVVVPASPAPSVVPAPWSNAAHVDPEEAYVASIASCHMLWWLSLAARAGLDVRSYEDRAVGVMARNNDGKLWVAEVTLYPKVIYAGRIPEAVEEMALHERAHTACFIANSVRTRITVAAA